eukprot:jgi/Tetstr1/464509/TSEL_009267.t1
MTQLPREQRGEAVLAGMLAELQEGAVLEASVYLARAGNSQLQGGRRGQVCRPARRLLRTLHRLGPGDGQRVVASALRAVAAQVDGSGLDVSCAAFWWSNMLMLRYHLGEDEDLAALADTAKAIEVSAFRKALATVWEGIILPSVVLAGQPASHGSALSAGLPLGGAYRSPPLRSPAGPHAGEEVAIQRWLDLLDAGHRLLAGVHCDELTAQLEPEVMKQVLRRIDQLVPYLPVKAGLVSFGVGLQLKLAMTRLLQWAIETGCSEEGTSTAELLPRMASAAALLMLPADQLADTATRARACPDLSMGDAHTLLARYEPDDFCPVAPEPGLLRILESQAREVERRGTADSLSLRAGSLLGGADIEALEDGYPSDLLARVERLMPAAATSSDIITDPPNTDSDEELTSLEEIVDRRDPGMSAELQRFELLRHLWGQPAAPEL